MKLHLKSSELRKQYCFKTPKDTHRKMPLGMASRTEKDLIALGGIMATDAGRVKASYLWSYQTNNSTLEDNIFLPPVIWFDGIYTECENL